jgi:transcription-repair coupling factor (superfamily II helicase)
MNLTGLLERLGDANPLQQLIDEVKRNKSATISAVVEAAYPAVTGLLYRSLEGSGKAPLLYVTSHPHRAESLVGELAPWLSIPVEHFPSLDGFPYERVPADRETTAKRQAIVAKMAETPCTVVTSVRALIQPVYIGSGLTRPMTLSSQTTLSPDDLLKRLLTFGYRHAPMVEEAGTFARRGGIVDVFPIGASHPVRIEFLGAEVDSLRLFDVVTQRSIEAVSTVGVLPLATVDDAERQESLALLEELDASHLTETARSRWVADLEEVRNGSGDALLELVAYSSRCTSLVDALHPAAVNFNPMVILEDPEALVTVADDLYDQAGGILNRMISAGELPEGLRPGLMPWPAIESVLKELSVVAIERGGGEEAVADRVFRRPRSFGGRTRELRQIFDPMVRTGRDVTVITSYQYARLQSMLEAEDIPITATDSIESLPEPGTITLVRGSLAEGWSAEGLGITLYTDHELFGWSKPRVTPRRKRAARDTFFTDFRTGDYVVHIEHGIGQLTGTTKMRDDTGIEREYLIVQYAGTDRLYVPADQVDRITRYVGVGEGKPQLSKLGGADWSRAKARAQKAAEDMAEELIALYARREAEGGHAFQPDTPWQSELESSFPFEETPDQATAIDDVKKDMEQSRPMDRLVVADVGYGKTEVAVRAAFKAVMDGMQVAVLVPTTILAHQHLETFQARLEAFPVKIDMLSRFRSAAERRDVLRRMAEGEVDIVIGTHMLLSKNVSFKNLGLLVVDEEQRFGVRHKERLKQLRAGVDVMTLTATPIPRTLHMSLTGIRDVSIIQTPPEGRLPIRTFLQPYDDRLIREAIVRELEREGQVYFVHNRVAGIEALAEKLRRLVPEARVIVGHGQMSEDHLEKVMLEFSHQQADVLLCSTIIESGLDIPNVNTIVIDHANALGLGQLYQLRGRVGRGANQAYAYLLYPREARIGPDAMKRMEAVFEATELGAGFQIAMADLEIRGAGNLLGAEQSGNVEAIGFDLYTSLLKNAIDTMRGMPVTEPTRVTIDLPFDVLIPPSYIPEERERLSVYRRISSLTATEDIPGMVEELRDRFGAQPPAVDNLLAQVHLKFLAQKGKIVSIVLRGDTLILKGERRIVFDRLGLFKRFGVAARINENTLRIDADRLGPNWISTIEDVLNGTIEVQERHKQLLADRVAVGA